jgi:riboflavin kinase / FMN adenylyltransferase
VHRYGIRPCPQGPVAWQVVQIHRDLSAPSDRPTVVTVGAYDGVHLGHRAVVAEVRRFAEERGIGSAVVTFDRHPATVVRPESAPKLLCDPEQKLELLATTGVDATWLIPFDEQRSEETAEDFVLEILVGMLRAKVVVVGEDFHFGKARGGNVALLRTLGEEHGFEVVGLDLVGGDPSHVSGRKVSSTQIRQLLAAGDVTRAEELLGRFHEVRGPVVHGDARGRTLGFPTANIAVPTDVCMPADGIYAGWYLRPDGKALPAALNLGRRPTFYDAQPYSLLEAFILDWSGDLYDEIARVEFVQRLRAEMKFDSIDALVDQMNSDVLHARKVLGL